MSRRPTGRSRRFPVQRVASGPAPVVLPASINIAGYEARDATTDVNGDIVTIPDLLGVNTITSVGGATARADLLADAGVGGELVADFGNNASHRIQRTTWSAGSVAAPFTIYLVAKHDNVAADTFCAGGSGNAPYLAYDGATDYDMNGGATLSTTDTPDTDWHAWCLIFEAGAASYFRDDFATAIATGAAGISPSINGVTLGAFTAGAGALDGRIFGWYAGTGAHDAATRAAVAAYLTQETGLSITV